MAKKKTHVTCFGGLNPDGETFNMTCPDCAGTGEDPSAPGSVCSLCIGEGFVRLKHEPENDRP
jgi:DnaJ-class molecular chaperone